MVTLFADIVHENESDNSTMSYDYDEDESDNWTMDKEDEHVTTGYVACKSKTIYKTCG